MRIRFSVDCNNYDDFVAIKDLFLGYFDAKGRSVQTAERGLAFVPEGAPVNKPARDPRKRGTHPSLELVEAACDS